MNRNENTYKFDVFDEISNLPRTSKISSQFFISFYLAKNWLIHSCAYYEPRDTTKPIPLIRL